MGHAGIAASSWDHSTRGILSASQLKSPGCCVRPRAGRVLGDSARPGCPGTAARHPTMEAEALEFLVQEFGSGKGWSLGVSIFNQLCKQFRHGQASLAGQGREKRWSLLGPHSAVSAVAQRSCDGLAHPCRPLEGMLLSMGESLQRLPRPSAVNPGVRQGPQAGLAGVSPCGQQL